MNSEREHGKTLVSVIGLSMLILLVGSAANLASALQIPATTTISDQASCVGIGGKWDGVNTCTITTGITVGSGETLTIPSGVVFNIANDGTADQEVGITVDSGGIIDNSGTLNISNTGGTGIVNSGTINNSGTMMIIHFDLIPYSGTVVNSGTINNSGISIIRGTLTNNASGVITNRGSFTNDEGNILNSGTLNNSAEFSNYSNLINNLGGKITNSGSLFSLGGLDNSGTIINACDATFTNTGRFTGNAVQFDCPSGQSTLTVRTQDVKGPEVTGVWTVIRLANGTIAKSGFTPLAFTGDAGTEYKVSVANYDGKVFQHWEDGVVESSRSIVLTSAESTLIATYDTGDSLRGFTPLTYSGTAQQPDLTVLAKSLDGTQTLSMYSIIDPQVTNSSSTTYKVYAGNYGNLTFDHWSDGNKDSIRDLTINSATTITAFYTVK